MKTYYECHITMDGNPVVLEQKVLAVGWKFSAIDGDPVLGNGVKCYATMHYSLRLTKAEIMKRLKTISEHLTEHGAKVIRIKLEHVLHDERVKQ